MSALKPQGRSRRYLTGLKRQVKDSRKGCFGV